jgi:hypothetical protein
MATKKEIKLYAEDKFFEVFGQVDDFETEWLMLSEELSDFRTNSDVDECLERLLEVYKEHMEDWSPVPKALE